MKKILLSLLITAVITIVALPIKASANEWHNDNGRDWLQLDDGSYPTGWYNYNGTYFLFDSDGYSHKYGWYQENGKWYFIQDMGRMCTDEFIDGYYVDKTGEYRSDIKRGDAIQTVAKSEDGKITLSIDAYCRHRVLPKTTYDGGQLYCAYKKVNQSGKVEYSKILGFTDDYSTWRLVNGNDSPVSFESSYTGMTEILMVYKFKDGSYSDVLKYDFYLNNGDITSPNIGFSKSSNNGDLLISSFVQAGDDVLKNLIITKPDGQKEEFKLNGSKFFNITKYKLTQDGNYKIETKTNDDSYVYINLSKDDL
ncbi:hypothetical protein [Clostridium sp. ZBS2]|uniref:hypothetical protein n=1 Tax=Clostridium sp. ZBS2 TaxID=2949976 RepID=UPI00207A00DF|nr:hypothetical protein [Clostridium sp. ZBS2]